MANYYGFTRTNYFAVKDGERLRQLVAACQTSEERQKDEESPDVWEKTVEGQTLFAFGCYGNLSGLPCVDGEDDEYDLNAFYEELQSLISDGHAIIITEIGHEKLSYLVGGCTIITPQRIAYTNLSDIGLGKARELLNNPQYNPIMDY